MNKRAESSNFVLIALFALVIIGVGFVAMIKAPTMTSYSVKDQISCYYVNDNFQLDIDSCCSEIKKSNGCTQLSDKELVCSGSDDLIVSKNTIKYCS